MPSGTRRVNGPILVVVVSLVVWAILGTVALVRVARPAQHVHTAECWDN